MQVVLDFELTLIYMSYNALCVGGFYEVRLRFFLLLEVA